MVLADTWTFWDGIWTMIVFFAWIMFFFWVITLLADNFRRRDHSGWAKAAWCVFLIFLPIIGAFAYTVARPKGEEAAYFGYEGPVQQAPPQRSTADELARLNELRAEGAISEGEYEQLKKKAIASA